MFLSLASSLLLLFEIRLTSSYCTGPGKNPSFISGPTVEQVGLTSVVVSWEGLVKQLDCADQFVVKWWNRNDPSDYQLSDMLMTSVTSFQANHLTPHRAYAFQAIAREDKGWLGADWNKSPTVYFTTTRHNPTVAPVHNDVKHPTVDKRVEEELNPDYGFGEDEDLYKHPQKGRPLTEEEDTRGTLSFLVIVGIVLAALLGVLVVVGVVYNITKKKEFEDDDEDGEDSDESSEDSLHLENYSPRSTRFSKEDYTPTSPRSIRSSRGTGRRDMTISYKSDKSEERY